MTRLSIAADHSPDLVAPIDFVPAFSATIQFDPTHAFETPRGERIYRKINGGEVTGRLAGKVYPNGGGEFSQRRPDHVTDINGHVLFQDANGEWLYLYHKGYQRPDGYYRLTAWVDADVRGRHDWVAGLFFLGIGVPGAGETMRIDYLEVA